MNILESVDNLIGNIQDKDIIYHYSLKKFPTLLTVNKRHELGLVDKSEYDKSLAYQNKHQFNPSYLDHISFLIDPLPVDLVRASFKDSNNDLYKSFKCYEYKININTLKDNLDYFNIVENPINVFFHQYLWIDTNFPGKDILYFGIRDLANKIVGNQGESFDKFKSAVKKYKGSTRKGFEELISNPEFNNYKKRGMYAPTVPHIMLYPTNGEIKYSSVNKVDL
jgi:hypothetical protein